MDLTDLILRWQSGEKEVEQQLYLYAYEHLKVIAQQERLRSSQKFGEHNPVFNELSNNTTALINEAYVKLSQYSDCDVGNRKQFYLLVSKVIRQILVDQARYFGAQKRQEITISERPKD
ncbi:ECF-type sigma factor, partial [Vibrio genomosp. F10]